MNSDRFNCISIFPNQDCIDKIEARGFWVKNKPHLVCFVSNTRTFERARSKLPQTTVMRVADIRKFGKNSIVAIMETVSGISIHDINKVMFDAYNVTESLPHVPQPHITLHKGDKRTVKDYTKLIGTEIKFDYIGVGK